jgi:hypothetical protein
MIEKSVRVSGSNYMLFRPNQVDAKEFYTEILTCQKSTWTQVMESVYTEPHNFVLYDVNKQLFHKNFNPIEFLDNDEEFDF